jgi:N-dimethylarginine dimethylaminohydrolase
MGDFVLADPAGFDVVYRLNELTPLGGPPVVKERARAQWERLRGRVEELTGRRVGVVPAATGLPDLVFVSNAALLFRGGDGSRVAVLARFAHSERHGESAVVGRWLRAGGWRVIALPEGAVYEGLGDSRWSHGGRHLWIGYGAGRTTLRGIEAVREALAAAGRGDVTVHALRLVSGRAYHLDLALCPFGAEMDRALWSPWAFAPAARATLERVFGSGGGRGRLVAVPVRYSWACNSVFISSGALLVPRDPAEGYRAWLREATGLRIVEVNISEFQKAGGGVSCMVLREPPRI